MTSGSTGMVSFIAQLPLPFTWSFSTEASAVCYNSSQEHATVGWDLLGTVSTCKNILITLHCSKKVKTVSVGGTMTNDKSELGWFQGNFYLTTRNLSEISCLLIRPYRYWCSLNWNISTPQTSAMGSVKGAYPQQEPQRWSELFSEITDIKRIPKEGRKNKTKTTIKLI